MDYNQEMAALSTGARVLAGAGNAIAAHEQSKRDVGNFASQFAQDETGKWFYTRLRWRDGAALAGPVHVSRADVARWSADFALARKRMTWTIFGLAVVMIAVLMAGFIVFARTPGALTDIKAYAIVGAAMAVFFTGVAFLVRAMNRRWDAPAAACIDRLGKLPPPRG